MQGIKWTSVNQSWNKDSQLSSINLPRDVSNLLVKTHSWVGNIIDIKIIEHWETNIWALFMRGLTTRIYDLLGISNINIEVFAQMTDTLSKQRAILFAEAEKSWVWKVVQLDLKPKPDLDNWITLDKAA